MEPPPPVPRLALARARSASLRAGSAEGLPSRARAAQWPTPSRRDWNPSRPDGPGRVAQNLQPSGSWIGHGHRGRRGRCLCLPKSKRPGDSRRAGPEPRPYREGTDLRRALGWFRFWVRATGRDEVSPKLNEVTCFRLDTCDRSRVPSPAPCQACFLRPRSRAPLLRAGARLQRSGGRHGCWLRRKLLTIKDL
jgi:hypothetical protein